MNIKNVEIAFKRFCRNKKKNYILMVPVTLMLFFCFMINMILFSLNNYIEIIKDSIAMRTIENVSYIESQYSEIKEKILENEHVISVLNHYEKKVYAIGWCDSLKNSQMTGFLFLYGSDNNMCPNVIKGRKIEKNELYTIVLPDKIYSNENFITAQNPINSHELIDGSQFLNKKIKIKLETETKQIEKDFLVVGIYDSEKYHDNKNVYISTSTTEQINTELKYVTEQPLMNIVVDKYENVNEVYEYLQENDIVRYSAIQKENDNNAYTIEDVNFVSSTNISLETLQIIKKVILVFELIVVLISVLILLVTNLNKVYIGATEIAIMKVEGYKNKDIHAICLLENIMIMIVSIILALAITFVFNRLINYFCNYILIKEIVGITANQIKNQIYYLSQIPRKLNLIYICTISLIAIIIEMINTFFINKRILKKDISEIFKEY